MINVAVAALVAASHLTFNSGFNWVCPMLDANPTEDGVWSVVLSAYQRGYSTEADAEKLVMEIASDCPEYIPLVKRWADHNA